MRTQTKSVLLADCDTDFRESLVNQLLMAGVEQVGVATNADELALELNGTEYDIVVLDHTLYRNDDVKSAIGRYRKPDGNAIIFLVEDQQRGMTIRALKSIDAYVCLMRSSAIEFLSRITRV